MIQTMSGLPETLNSGGTKEIYLSDLLLKPAAIPTSCGNAFHKLTVCVERRNTRFCFSEIGVRLGAGQFYWVNPPPPKL